MMIYIALIAVLYAGSCMGQFGMGGCAIDQKCYAPCPDFTLADAFPFIRQTPVSCEDCMKLCNQLQTGSPPFKCQSAVYDAQVGSCDIFAVTDYSSGYGRRKRNGGFNSGGADFGNGGGGGGGGGSGGQKVPHKQKYPGRIFLQPTGACAGQGGNDTGSTAAGGATTSAGSSGGADTSAATTTAATTTAAMKKKIRDQQPIRRKDDAGAISRCIAHRTSSNRRDCSTGIRFANGRRQLCKPTKAECDAS